MIDLTPLEVRKKKEDFRKGLRGYETGEVDGFIDLVADRMDQLVRENAGLRDRLVQLSEELEVFRMREQAMNDALVSAQQLREDIGQQARRESELSIREARAKGDLLVADAKKGVEEQEQALERLQNQRDRFLRNYRAFVEAQLDELAREEERIVRARVGEITAPEEHRVG